MDDFKMYWPCAKVKGSNLPLCTYQACKSMEEALKQIIYWNLWAGYDLVEVWVHDENGEELWRKRR